MCSHNANTEWLPTWACDQVLAPLQCININNNPTKWGEIYYWPQGKQNALVTTWKSVSPGTQMSNVLSCHPKAQQPSLQQRGNSLFLASCPLQPSWRNQGICSCPGVCTTNRLEHRDKTPAIPNNVGNAASPLQPQPTKLKNSLGSWLQWNLKWLHNKHDALFSVQYSMSLAAWQTDHIMVKLVMSLKMFTCPCSALFFLLFLLG